MQARRLPLLAAAAGAAAAVRYDGHHVLRVEAGSAEAARRARAALVDDAAAAAALGLDWWREPTPAGGAAEVRVPPGSAAAARRALRAAGANVTTTSTDLQRELDAMVANRSAGRGRRFDYEEYHTLAEIEDWIDDMAAEHRSIASVVPIGTSYEGRPIRALRIGAGARRDKPKIWSGHGIHAREWLSHSSGLWIVRELLHGYGRDADATRLVDSAEWWFVLAVNPDGYAYSWETDRMWRKTRMPTSNPSCVGIDANRNWAYQWGGEGSSGDPCSSSYRGEAPEDQPEVRAVAHFIRDNGFAGVVDMHCCGAMWMTPWAYTYDHPPDYAAQDAVSAQAAAAIRAVHGVAYRHGTVADVIYTSAGCVTDYCYHTAGAVYALAIEIHGSFTSPAREIRPRGEELWAGYKAYASAVIAAARG